MGTSRRDSSALGVDLTTPALIEPPLATVGPTPERLIVACVCWGDKYSDDYVLRLQRAVRRWLNISHEFICLSDRQIEGVRCIPVFENSWESWWQKIALFTPQVLPAGARILYLDLDVVLTGTIDDLAQLTADEPVIMLRNFGPNRPHCAHNSSIMLWTAGDLRAHSIHDLFTNDVMGKLHGDQCWIWRVLRDKIANIPQGWALSYKYDIRGRVQQPQWPTAAVVFHGNPKPHSVDDRFVKSCW